MTTHITTFKKLPLQTRVQYIAQALLYLFIAPRAFEFFYGTSAIAMWSWQYLAISLVFMVIFGGTYALAVYVMQDTTARERWALFFLSFVLVPVPLALAYRFSQKMQNIWASIVGGVATYIVTQIAVSYLFRICIYLIDRFVA